MPVVVLALAGAPALRRVLNHPERGQPSEQLGGLTLVLDACHLGHFEAGCPGVFGDRGEHSFGAVGDTNLKLLAHQAQDLRRPLRGQYV